MLIDCHYHNCRLADYLYKKEYRELGQYRGALGIDALFRYGRSGQLNREQLRSAAISFMQEQLYLIIGTRKNNVQVFYQELKDTAAFLLQAAAEFQGYVFFDLEAGEQRETLSLMEQMDQLVICLPQNPMVIQEYFQKYSLPLSRTYFLLGNYRQESRFNRKNLQNHFRSFHSYNLGTLSYCCSYGDALVRGEGLRYLLKAESRGSTGRKGQGLIRELEQIQNQLIRRLESKEEEDEAGKRRKIFH